MQPSAATIRVVAAATSPVPTRGMGTGPVPSCGGGRPRCYWAGFGQHQRTFALNTERTKRSPFRDHLDPYLVTWRGEPCWWTLQSPFQAGCGARGRLKAEQAKGLEPLARSAHRRGRYWRNQLGFKPRPDHGSWVRLPPPPRLLGDHRCSCKSQRTSPGVRDHHPISPLPLAVAFALPSWGWSVCRPTGSCDSRRPAVVRRMPP